MNKATVKKWVHLGLLVLVIAAVLVTVLSGAIPSTSGKLAMVGAVATALLANLSTIFKKTNEAVDAAFPDESPVVIVQQPVAVDSKKDPS